MPSRRLEATGSQAVQSAPTLIVSSNRRRVGESKVTNEPARTADDLSDMIDRVADGDRNALKNLYDATSPKLFGICLRISRSRESAEDVLQEVYLKIWNRAAQYDRSKGSPIAWMAVIARNSAIDARRRARPQMVGEEMLAGVPDESPLGDALIEHDQLRAHIEDCLDELEEKHRDCVRKAYFEGHSYSQVAALVDTPLNTVKGWMRRAFLSLRECLDG